MIIATLGGGHGQEVVLRALKPIPGTCLRAIYPVSDDGGSTGIFVQEGLLSMGDLTRGAAALCPDERWADLLAFRHKDGSLFPHRFGNMLLATLLKQHGPKEGLARFHLNLGLKSHKVYPVSFEPTVLWGKTNSGEIIHGESQIDTLWKRDDWSPALQIQSVWLEPGVKPNLDVREALQKADHIVICPGSLFTSLAAVLLPLREIVSECQAPVTIVVNLIEQAGQTNGVGFDSHVLQVERWLGRKASCVIGNTEAIEPVLLGPYQDEHKQQVMPPSPDSQIFEGRRVVLEPLLSYEGNKIAHSNVVLQEIFFAEMVKRTHVLSAV